MDVFEKVMRGSATTLIDDQESAKTIVKILCFKFCTFYKGRLGKNWERLCRSIETTEEKKYAIRELKKAGLKEPGFYYFFFQIIYYYY